jgi:hypothetical protein
MGVSPTSTFDAFNLKPGTQYKFRVTPRNRYGWGESVTTTAAIVVGCKVELPEFTRILTGQLKALQGSSISLECEVTESASRCSELLSLSSADHRTHTHSTFCSRENCYGDEVRQMGEFDLFYTQMYIGNTAG